MTAIRVFVVDDAAAIRRLLVQILEEEADIVIAGTARDGGEALQRLPQVPVDVLLLDIEMPGMSGLDLLRRLRQSGTSLPVLLFSSLTERGAMVTIEALLLGANDYVTKPSGLGSAGAAREYVRQQLLPRIRELAGRGRPAVVSPPRPPRQALAGPIDAIVIGVSTGGPVALHELVPALPADFPVPVFIVQHMPAFFTRALAERLSRLSVIAVRECRGELPVVPGTVTIAMGGAHLRIESSPGGPVVRADADSPPVNSCRPAADVLFESAVAVYGARVLGLVMTGMGQDGLAGSHAIVRAGGQVFVQDEASSVIWGMPRCVHEAGLASRVLPLKEIAAALVAASSVEKKLSSSGRDAR